MSVSDNPAVRAGGPATVVGHLLSVAKSVRQLVGIELAGIDVLVGQDQFLLCFDLDDALSVADVAARLSVRPSTVSKMVDILERKGWVVRSPDRQDARRVLVRLTTEGLSVRDRVQAVEMALDAELVTSLGDDHEMLPTLARLDAVLGRRLSRLR